MQAVCLIICYTIQATISEKPFPEWTPITGHTEWGFIESVWTLAGCWWWAGWCMTKQTRKAVSMWLWAKFSTCTVSPSPLCPCSWLIKSQRDIPKRKTQPHTEINNPGHLVQDTWAKPVPLPTTRKIFLVFVFCNCFKTATSQETNGKKCHGIHLLWIQFKSKPQGWSKTNFWSGLIKSRNSQTLGEILKAQRSLKSEEHNSHKKWIRNLENLRGEIVEK